MEYVQPHAKASSCPCGSSCRFVLLLCSDLYHLNPSVLDSSFSPLTPPKYFSSRGFHCVFLSTTPTQSCLCSFVLPVLFLCQMGWILGTPPGCGRANQIGSMQIRETPSSVTVTTGTSIPSALDMSMLPTCLSNTRNEQS